MSRTPKRKGYGKVVPIDESENLSGPAWGVWSALATFAKWETQHGQPIRSKEGSCIPRLDILAQRAHITKPTVIAAIRELEQAGYVRKESRYTEPKIPGGKGKQRSNGYTLYPNGDAPELDQESAKEYGLSLMREFLEQNGME